MEDGEQMEEKEMQKELGLFNLKTGGKGGDFLLSSVSRWEVLGKVEPGSPCNLFLYSWF